ncbi:MAG: DUF2141 domain-containing protein [Hyphomonadaceae bacterium]|nr:DUF2141 domain-containing protein [Hyphomonadaceae bacterium]GIK48586.1 MAG: hypothetical protein BroJett013_12830 [Alphaproteobacteria bacterium]
MRVPIVLAACSVALAILVVPPAHANPITLDVRVDNVTPNGGAVRVAVYDESRWLGEPVAGLQADADGESVILRFSIPTAGRFGVAAYQDSNGDGRLNRNSVGMPTEPFAFSNDADARFGPPRFSDAALDISTAARTTITLR